MKKREVSLREVRKRVEMMKTAADNLWLLAHLHGPELGEIGAIASGVIDRALNAEEALDYMEARKWEETWRTKVAEGSKEGAK